MDKTVIPRRRIQSFHRPDCGPVTPSPSSLPALEAEQTPWCAWRTAAELYGWLLSSHTRCCTFPRRFHTVHAQLHNHRHPWSLAAPRGEQLALQAIPAGQVASPTAGVSLPRRTHQAAVTSVRDVTPGTAGARTRAHVAPGGARLR